jgi:hypothetical protein
MERNSLQGKQKRLQSLSVVEVSPSEGLTGQQFKEYGVLLHRKRLELYARLASIPALKDLKEWEKLKLLDEVQELAFGFVKIKLGDVPLEDPKTPEWVKKLTPWDILTNAHTWIRSALTNLFNGDGVPLKPLLERDNTVLRWDPSPASRGEVQWEHEHDWLRDEILVDFVYSLRQFPFPYRRCPVCPTIFVPVKRQKYCSPACTAKGTEAARKDERRKYMREYMAKKRKKAKPSTRKAR